MERRALDVLDGSPDRLDLCEPAQELIGSDAPSDSPRGATQEGGRHPPTLWQSGGSVLACSTPGMSGRDHKGWSGILGDLHDPPPEERTDPHLEVGALRFEDQTQTDDAVLNAMTELDGPLPASVRAKRNDPPATPPGPLRPVAPPPRGTAAPSAAAGSRPAPMPAAPAVPAPAAAKPKLKLPTPVGPPTGPTRIPTPPLGLEEEAAPGFSSASLMDKLEPTPAAPKGPRPATQVEAGGSLWSEYKEVILSVVGGVLLVGGVLIYQRWPSAEPVIIGDPAPPPAPVVEGPATPTPPPPNVGVATHPGAVAPPPPPVEVVEPPPPTTIKAAIPMLTLLSSPSGATVEINGVEHGKTPLIVPAPRDLERLSVILKLDGYKKWVGEVSPNEAGHYSSSIKLEPLR